MTAHAIGRPKLISAIDQRINLEIIMVIQFVGKLQRLKMILVTFQKTMDVTSPSVKIAVGLSVSRRYHGFSEELQHYHSAL